MKKKKEKKKENWKEDIIMSDREHGFVVFSLSNESFQEIKSMNDIK